MPPHDPITFVTIALVLSCVGVLAAYVPGRRATRVDSARTLRDEQG